MRSEPNPEPVPPLTEWNIRNPYNPEHFSASFLILSKHWLMIVFPILWLPLIKLSAASSVPEIKKSGWNKSR